VNSGCCQVVADRLQRARCGIDMTNGGRHSGITDPQASEPEQFPVPPEVMGCGAPIGKAKTRHWRSARHSRESAAVGRQEVPERSETDRQVEASAKGRPVRRLGYPVGFRCARRACARCQC